MRSCVKAVAVARGTGAKVASALVKTVLVSAVLVSTVLVSTVLVSTVRAQPAEPAEAYRELRAREATVRADMTVAPLTARSKTSATVRSLVREYEDLARRHPTSGYSDNALWQGAVLAGDLYHQFHQPTDKRTAQRLFTAIGDRFPTSSLVPKVAGELAGLDVTSVTPAAVASGTAGQATTAPGKSTSVTASVTTPVRAPVTASVRTPVRTPATTGATGAAAQTVSTTGRPIPVSATATDIAGKATGLEATLLAIRRDVLPQAVRVTLVLDGETPFSSEELVNPARVFIDLRQTRALYALKDMKLAFPDDMVRQIRLGRPDDQHLRVVLDLANSVHFSIYPMYNPYRLVIDFERSSAREKGLPTLAMGPPEPVPASTPPVTPPVTTPPRAMATTAATSNSKTAATAGSSASTGARESRTAAAATAAPSSARGTAAAPAAPAANGRGGFSLSRQLGLGISRIVIDPGHGGHDPGASGNGLTESELALDVALRLEKKLAQQPTVEVILTRRTSVYVSLEERTAMANKANADLFLSIHANASENSAARGTETYFLSFAPDAASEAIAARENAASSRTMRNLPDMVKAITLNDKIDESRDFARLVQAQLHEGSKKGYQRAKNLGVKQAPFQVLIGAAMPSILTEISFITNEDEGELLKTEKYKDSLAEALYNGVMAYQRALKKSLVAANDH